jgi:pilus assembly protein CpaB
MGRRTVLLVVALVVAGLGTAMVFLYVNGVNERALARQEPVAVLMAKRDIAAGTSVADAEQAGAFEKRTITRDAAAPGVLSDLAPVEGEVALAPIFAGEQILREKFGASAEQNALPVPDDKLAVSVQLGDPERVGGFLRPGSEVAVFVTIAGGRNGAGPEETRVLLPRVEVIAAGASTLVPQGPQADGGTAGEDVPTAILTLAVDQEEASKIGYARGQGDMFFALRGENAEVSVSGDPIDAESLFD